VGGELEASKKDSSFYMKGEEKEMLSTILTRGKKGIKAHKRTAKKLSYSFKVGGNFPGSRKEPTS